MVKATNGNDKDVYETDKDVYETDKDVYETDKDVYDTDQDKEDYDYVSWVDQLIRDQAQGGFGSISLHSCDLNKIKMYNYLNRCVYLI